MDRFCTYCGKLLPEDGVCGCQPEEEETTSLDTTKENAQVAEPQAPGETAPQECCTQTDMAEDLPMFHAAPAGENVYWKKLKEPLGRLTFFLRDYWRDPIKTTTGVLKARDSALAVTMMVLHVILAGFILFVASSKILQEKKIKLTLILIELLFSFQDFNLDFSDLDLNTRLENC